MTTLPKIGSRVSYLSRSRHWSDRKCTGTVMAHYPGGERLKDQETGEYYITAHHAGVQVDAPLPAWWAYNGTDRFAPSIDELSPLTTSQPRPVRL